MNEPVKIARFVFGITGIFYADGKVGYLAQDANERVPKEVVILQLKAFVKKMEKEYFA